MPLPPPDDEADAPPEPAEGDAGDRLAQVGARAGLSEEAVDALAGWLARELESDRYAQLERAGHNVEDRIPLARVFVDLHAAPVPVDDGERAGATEPLVALLDKPREERREPALLHDARRDRDAPRAFAPDRIEGYAVVGGPGQGKSTLGQLVCQLHRAWLLRPRGDRIEHGDAVAAFSGER